MKLGRAHMRARKRTLQVNNIKKKSNMITTVVTSDDGLTIDDPGDPITMNGASIYGFLFSPSAREWSSFDTIYARRRSLVYARGYREKGVMEITNGTGWMWRRIVFATKSRFWQTFPAGTLQLDISGTGYVRTLWNFLGGGTNQNAAKDVLEDMLFKGTAGSDWVDRFTASVDTTRVTVIKDRVRQVGLNGSTTGRFENAHGWFPINKNLRYDEDEDGSISSGEKQNTPWSTEGSVGVGNIFVYDIFSAAGSNANSDLTWEPQGTWFWHER